MFKRSHDEAIYIGRVCSIVIICFNPGDKQGCTRLISLLDVRWLNRMSLVFHFFCCSPISLIVATSSRLDQMEGLLAPFNFHLNNLNDFEMHGFCPERSP